MPRRSSLIPVSLFALSLVALLALPSAATAAPRIYEGREAAALRCANTLALTAVALSAAELIGEGEKNVMLGITVRILDRHVEGTWAQKRAAMEVMRDRRSVADTLEDYRQIAERCLVQFPIN
ncbi:hypothetical protein K3759_11290 [Sulfitobacter sp. W027]|uniref:hypothetical protein n=1 Tax=Sulfitobacter sp. W027 TaxID=2867025 RepID=UPI0021A53747|nr:hypothetical protein [Sulfitobacter sp. W027]UWR32539.1 hypothetical protein K3759_11290 [Sulfitobacter sp. W027]